jgi:hypothetical protein
MKNHHIGKNFWIILITLTVILSFIISPSTFSVKKGIADFVYHDIPMGDSLRQQLQGPLILDKGDYVEFNWYKVLEWNDSANLYIDVFKYPVGKDWSRFFAPRVTMDWQWYYFLFPNGTSTFDKVLPKLSQYEIIDHSKYKLYSKINHTTDSVKFDIQPERLLYFLKKGFFTVIEKSDTYTIVDFYEPIAAIGGSQTNDLISTMSAKVYINDSFEVLISPYIVPIEMRNKN